MKHLIFTLLLFFTGLYMHAQKAAIVGVYFDSGDPVHIGDQIAFVALQDLPPGTKLYLTTEEYNKDTQAFCEGPVGSCVRTEEMITWQATTTVPKGDVIIITKLTDTNTPGPQAGVTCSGTGGASCGTVTIPLLGKWQNSNDMEQVYLFEDNDNDMTNGVTNILSAVHYDMGSATPTTMPDAFNPIMHFPNVWIVSINTNTLGMGFVGFEIPDIDRLKSNLTQSIFENPNNYARATTLSTEPFCGFSVTCPTNSDWGSFNCNTLSDIPDLPSLINNSGDYIVDNADGDYGIDVGDGSCGTIRVQTTDDETANICALSNQSITRTVFIYDDTNGNEEWDDDEEYSECTFTFTIQADDDAPTWTTQAGALDRSLSCSDVAGLTTAQALFPVAADVCDKDVTNIVKTPGNFVEGDCPNSGTYTNTWKVTDACGNTSAEYTQVITLVDNTAPVINCPSRKTIACEDSREPSYTGNATATDNCSATIDIDIRHQDGDFTGSCAGGGEFIRTWTATDECGKSASCKQTITVSPAQEAEFETEPADVTVCGAENIPIKKQLSYDNQLDGDCEISGSVESSDSQGSPMADGCYKITRIWSYTDDCEREITAEQIIYVIPKPSVDIAMDIVGVDYPTSKTCGNFDVLLNVTVCNNGNVDVQNLDVKVDLQNLSNGILVGLVSGPTHVSGVNLSSKFNGAYTGKSGKTQIFSGNAKLDKGDGNCSTFRIRFEVAPNKTSAGAASSATFNATANAKADCNVLDNESTFDASVVCTSAEDAANVSLGDCWQKSRIAAANDLINVSLIGCEAVINPDMMLENHYSGCDTGSDYPLGGFYRIRILEHGQIEPGAPQLYATVNINDFPGGRVIVYIENVSKACEPLWGEVKLEDKTGPTISCPAPVSAVGEDDLLCSDVDEVVNNANYPGIPRAISEDDCGNPVLTFKDRVVEDGNCGNITLTRTWTATDEQGRKASCNQTITFRRPTLEEVDKPTTELQVSCDFTDALLDIDANNDNIPDYTIAQLLDENGHPTPLALELLHGQGAGFPYIGDHALNESYCNIGADYKDIAVIEVCGNTVKIVRQWTILDWCDIGDQNELNNGTTVNHRQIIKYGDFSSPVLTDPGDKTTIPTGPFGCYGTYKVKGIDADDISENCSANLSVQATLYKTTIEPKYDQYGRKIGEGPVTVKVGPVSIGQSIRIDLGVVYTIKYKVTDDCGNVSNEVDLDVEARDAIEPVAVCDDDLHISIGGEGLARITDQDVDEGSWDNCSPVSTFISRKLVGTSLRDAYLSYVYELSFSNLVLSNLDDKDNSSPADIYVKDDNKDGKWSSNETTPILRLKNGMWYTWWSKELFFLCDDMNERVIIELLAVDAYGNTNVCWNDVLIEDKIAPYCVAPAAVTWDCTKLPYGFDPNNDAQLAQLFGNASATDNCPGATATQVSKTIVDWDCNSGTIIRTFKATDAKGRPSTNDCKQTVTINRVHNYEIVFPKDPAPVVCGEASLDQLITNVIACDLLSVNVQNDTFTASGDACYKIKRTYQVINWCEYDGDDPAVEISRNEDNDGLTGEHDVYVLRDAVMKNGYNVYIDDDSNEKDAPLRRTVSTGYWTYVQFIKVIDNIAPEITIGGDDVFCSFDNVDCDAAVIIPVTVTDECAGPDVKVKAFVDGQQVTVTGTYPNYTVTGNFDLGVYTLEVHAIDGCQNTELAVKNFTVADCKAPAPICINGLAIELMPTEPGTDVDGDDEDDPAVMIVWATDFRVSGIDDCSDEVTLSINRAGETPNKNSASLTLTCKDPDTLAVEIYAWDNADNPTAVQPDGTLGGSNYDFCVTYVIIQDNMFDLCEPDPAKVAVSGLISTEKDDPVEDVEVRLSGAQNMEQMTLVDGSYVFANLSAGGDYTIAPRKNNDYLNGVSTFDIVLITKHVLGTNRLKSPYKLIAADINRSNTVSTLDLIQLRKLVLSVDSKFRNNTSWRFVPASYVFPKPEDPWFAPFPEVFSVNDISSSLNNTDFVAIKVGDLNGNAIANSLLSTGRDIAGLLEINTDDQQVTAGTEYRVAFKAGQKDIQGFQFTLQYEGLELIDIEYGIAQSDHFGVLEDGVITTSWNQNHSESLHTDAELFTLVFRARQSGKLSDLIRINSRFTLAEAYTQSDELLGVALRFGKSMESVSAPILYQNVPNPFQGQTVIGFELPAAAQATITIQDVTGKTLKMIRGEYARGYSQIQIHSDELPGSGVLYYTLSTDKFTETKKMIVTSGF